jgi:hypothetical protein
MALSVAPRLVIVVVRRKHQATSGVTVRFTIDRSAAVLIAVQHRLTGRLRGNRCVATTRRNAASRRCTRYVTIKSFTIKNAKAGASRLRYAGRVRNRVFAAGAYRVVVVALNAGGWSRERSASFKVVDRKAAS